MFKIGFSLVFTIFAFCLNAQIDMKDSTATAIGYWSAGELQNYKVTNITSITDKEDTLSYVTVSYDIELKIVDSNSVNYIIEWKRKNYSFSNNDEFKRELETVGEGFPIQVLTNEYGSDVSILNWEDYYNSVTDKIDALKKKYIGEASKIFELNKLARRHKDKESIEQFCVKDIQQFFAYHGAKYKLGETIKARIKIPNNYGGDELNADAVMMMDALLPENNTYIVKSFQNIDPAQLKAVTYDYLSKINITGSELPSYEDFPTITKQIWGGTEIHGPTGWVIYSQESEQINTGSEVTLKERLIEIQNDKR